MIDYLRVLKHTLERDGLASATIQVVRRLYIDVWRKAMPTTGYVSRSGIPSASEEIKLGDRLVGRRLLPDHLSAAYPDFSIPEYEDALIRGLEEKVREGDCVLIVGGGNGITSTIAAEIVGSGGTIYVYEGSKKMADRTRKTLELNGVLERCEVHHAIVGEAISLRRGGDLEDTPIVSPEDLPNCEVMELDCEGAELTILRNVKSHPRVILVESHGSLGTPSREVASVLNRKGYKIDWKSIADSRLEETCKDKDIFVLAAVREN